MIVKFAKKLVSWQIQKGHLPKEKENLYTYAYELLIGQAVNILVACLLAFFFHAYVPVLVYLVAYIPLRSYAGGHHADTYLRCTLVSAVIICAVCICIRIIPSESILLINLLGTGISGCMIFLFAPVPDYNKPLDSKETIVYKQRSQIIWLAETVLWIICYIAGNWTVSLVIVLAHISLAALLFLGILKNKYVKSELK